MFCRKCGTNMIIQSGVYSYLECGQQEPKEIEDTEADIGKPYCGCCDMLVDDWEKHEKSDGHKKKMSDYGIPGQSQRN